MQGDGPARGAEARLATTFQHRPEAATVDQVSQDHESVFQDHEISGEPSLTADSGQDGRQPGGGRQRGAGPAPYVDPTPPVAAYPGPLGRCVELPGTGIVSVSNYGISAELIASLVLLRAHRGGVTKLGDRYLDRGFPTPGYLARTFEEFTVTGLLALADPDPGGLRRITLTDAGHARYAELAGARPSSPEPVATPPQPTAPRD